MSLRFTLDATGKPNVYGGDQRMVVEAPESALLCSCFEEALLALRFGDPKEPTPFAYFTLQFYAQAKDAPELQDASAPAKVVRREGGTCWERRDHPCAPNKVCQAAEDVRVRCPPRQ